MSSPSPATASAAALRPWQQFVNPSALSIPISFSEATYRLSQNLRFFLPNYAVLTVLIFLATLLTRPLALIFFLCIFSTAIYLLFSRDEETLTLLGYDIDQKIIAGILAVITLIVLLWTGVWLKLFTAIIISGVIVVVHGVLRAPEESLEDSPYGSLLNVVDDPRGEYASV